MWHVTALIIDGTHTTLLKKMKKNRKWDIQFGDNVLDVSVVRVPYAWQLSHAVKGAVLTTSPATLLG